MESCGISRCASKEKYGGSKCQIISHGRGFVGWLYMLYPGALSITKQYFKKWKFNIGIVAKMDGFAYNSISNHKFGG